MATEKTVITALSGILTAEENYLPRSLTPEMATTAANYHLTGAVGVFNFPNTSLTHIS